MRLPLTGPACALAEMLGQEEMLELLLESLDPTGVPKCRGFRGSTP
jgi:hypothetical protein